MRATADLFLFREYTPNNGVVPNTRYRLVLSPYSASVVTAVALEYPFGLWDLSFIFFLQVLSLTVVLFCFGLLRTS